MLSPADIWSAAARSDSAREVALTLAFVGFLYPVTLDVLSVNYSFLLFPLMLIARRGRLRAPPPLAVVAMAAFTVVLVAASLYQVDFLGASLRRVVSFALFMGIFTYMFIELDTEMIRAFKWALVTISVVLSLSAVVRFDLLGGSTLGFEAKDLVGSQRFGFLYLLAFWLGVFYRPRSGAAAAARIAVLTVLAAGLLLTFSRSSIVSLLSSFALFGATRLFAWARRPQLGNVLRALVSLAGIAVVLGAVSALFPVTLTFFDERIVTLLFSGDAAANLADPATSEGTRVFLLERILAFVRSNPFTGSGFLGVWIVTGDLSGSAHSQYTDVLFRTGVVGFAMYAGLMLALLRFLARADQPLFWGLVSVLVYGVFHETFKESQGAFVLTFLLGMMAQAIRDRRRRRSPASASAQARGSEIRGMHAPGL